MRRFVRRAVLAFLLLLAPVVGPQGAGAQLLLHAWPEPAGFIFKGQQLITIYAIVESTVPIQAFDIDVNFDPTLLKAIVVNGLDVYDGDDALLLGPTVDNASGVIQGIVDARLGAPGPTGTIFFASLVFRLLQVGEGSISFNAFVPFKGFADDTGQALSGFARSAIVFALPFIDQDLDGLPDEYETSITQTDPLKKDTDGDGIQDGQEDTDGDGVADAAEFNAGSDVSTQDSDTDGQLDGADNCPHTYNPTQVDGDSDGLGDACDPDRDQDQLEDVDEPALGLDPGNPDTDGDGWLDGVELARGTDPLDDTSFPVTAPALGPVGWVMLALLIAWAGARRIRPAG
jgi:hypothetical protein